MTAWYGTIPKFLHTSDIDAQPKSVIDWHPPAPPVLHERAWSSSTIEQYDSVRPYKRPPYSGWRCRLFEFKLELQLMPDLPV